MFLQRFFKPTHQPLGHDLSNIEDATTLLPSTIPPNASNSAWHFKLTDTLQALPNVCAQYKCYLSTIVVAGLLCTGSTIGAVSLSKVKINGQTYKGVKAYFGGIDNKKPEANLGRGYLSYNSWSEEYGSINNRLKREFSSLNYEQKQAFSPYLNEGEDVDKIGEPDIAGINVVLANIQAFAKRVGLIVDQKRYYEFGVQYQPSADRDYSHATEPPTSILCTNGNPPDIEIRDRYGRYGEYDRRKYEGQFPSLEETYYLKGLSLTPSCSETITFMPNNPKQNTSSMEVAIALSQASAEIPLDYRFFDSSLSATFLPELPAGQVYNLSTPPFKFINKTQEIKLELNLNGTTLDKVHQQATKLNNEIIKTFDALFNQLDGMLKNNTLPLLKDEIKALKELIDAREALKPIYKALIASAVVSPVSGIVLLLSLCTNPGLRNKLKSLLMSRQQKIGGVTIQLANQSQQSAVDLGEIV